MHLCVPPFAHGLFEREKQLRGRLFAKGRHRSQAGQYLLPAFHVSPRLAEGEPGRFNLIRDLSSDFAERDIGYVEGQTARSQVVRQKREDLTARVVLEPSVDLSVEEDMP